MSSAALRDGILHVPVIDIACFRMPYADAAARSEIVRRVDEAARTVGFMQITGHGISPVTLAEFTRATSAFLEPKWWVGRPRLTPARSPMLASDVGGVREVVVGSPGEPVPALLVPPDDPGQLASALRRWLTEPGLRADLRQAAAGRRTTLPSWSATVRKFSGTPSRA